MSKQDKIEKKETIKYDNKVLQAPMDFHPMFPRIVDKVVDIYTYTAVLGLIGYMLVSLFDSFYSFGENILGINIKDTGNPYSQEKMLHVVAFTIVLVKAYNILLEYTKTKHINIKYIVEIAIIASVVELIFNTKSHGFYYDIFLGIFGFAMTVIYLLFYKTMKEVEKDYEEEYKKITEENGRKWKERMKKRKRKKEKK